MSNQTVFTILNNCLAAPTVVADTGCVACGASVVIDVLDNDTANAPGFNNASLVISTPPNYGVATPNADGTITYTAPAGYSGSAVFKYKITNTNGIVSAEATVTVTVVCPGIGSTVILCS